MHRALSFLLLVVLVGCASVPARGMPPFQGTSSLDDALKADGYARAYALARTSGCSSIDRVVDAAYTLDWANEANMLGSTPRLQEYVKSMYARSTAPPTIAEAFAATQ